MKTQDNVTVVTAETLGAVGMNWGGEENWYLIRGDVSSNDRVECADCNIILEDGCYINLDPGGLGGYMTIWGQNQNYTQDGGLRAHCRQGTSAIGGASGEGVTLTINGGVIDAADFSNGYGISVDDWDNYGKVVIHGGQITASVGYGISGQDIDITGGHHQRHRQYLRGPGGRLLLQQ